MDYESFQKFFNGFLPANAARRTGDIFSIIGNVMGRYIRSTIVLSIIAGVMVFLGLLALGIEHAAALAALAYAELAALSPGQVRDAIGRTPGSGENLSAWIEQAAALAAQAGRP